MAMKIETGSRVAIIGGGPAGVFFAFYLLRYGEMTNVRPEITIYQQRNFMEGGPKGCKGCAGILSVSLLSSLKELGLILPDEIIQDKITAYTIHSPYTSISITNPEKEKEIATIFRGGGPRLPHGNEIMGFDGWLLGQAQSHGIMVENRTVSCINLGPRSGIEVAGNKFEYDLIVLASGVSTKPVTVTGLDYVPPKVRTMAVDELYADTDEIESRMGNAAHGFLIPQLGIVFGGLVPKGPFITVTLLSSSKSHVNIEDFLSYDIVKDVLPQHYERSCGCRPKAVVGPASNYFADRFVAIGDAAVSKLYQDGITSTLVLAQQAAHAAVYYGISRQDFAAHYEPAFRALDRDNRWGGLLFTINHRAKDSKTFLLAQHRLTAIEQDNTRGRQPFTRAAWGMLTGTYGYEKLMRGLLRPISVIRLFRELFLEGIRSWFKNGKATSRKLHVGGRKVLILGGGFGGIYTLKYLVPALNRNESVETTLISNENYFLFTPLLHEVALGRIETRDIAYPFRSLHWKDRFTFVQANVEKIDLNLRKVTTSAGTLDFDFLVMSLGSITDTSPVGPDWVNVFTLQNLDDAVRIRNHIISIFEQAVVEKNIERQRKLLTFVVAGAGYAGIQIVTGLKELVRSSLPRFYPAIESSNIRIILVEKSPKIVPELHARLGAYIMKYLRKVGIEVRLESRVTKVRENGVEINNDENIPSSTLIWVSDVAVNPQISELDVARDNVGRVIVNEFLEVPEVPGVYAVGDCAHIKNPVSGRPIPPLAHTAVRQAKIAARNILADIRGLNRRPYYYSKPLDLVSLGNYNAVFRFRKLRMYGFFPRLILAFLYVFLIAGTSNRIRMAIDWMLSIVFGRDMTIVRQNKRK
jgi:NADH:ubiquinone reductase (H+-translocating)